MTDTTRSAVIETWVVTIASFGRRSNTASGNPRYALLTSDGRVFLTADDTADSFGWVPERLTARRRPVGILVDTGP